MQRMQLDKATGGKCFTLSVSALQIPYFSDAPLDLDFPYCKRGKRFDHRFSSFIFIHS